MMTVLFNYSEADRDRDDDGDDEYSVQLLHTATVQLIMIMI